MLVAMCWDFGGQEEGFAVYKGNASLTGTPNLTLAENKTDVDTSVSRILPKGTEVEMVLFSW